MKHLSNLLNITHPIVQAPMLGITTPAMVAAVSNAGALGSLPVGGLSPERTRELIRATKSLTNRPFAVNLFAHEPAPEINKAEIELMQDFLAGICAEYSIPYQRQDADAFKFYYYEDLIDVLLEENIPIVSVTFGQLKPDVISALKQNNVKLIGTATGVAEAKILAQSGVDAITVQGIEAGGHRGSFLPESDLPQVGLFSLLPQVAGEVDLPLLAAGGIYDARTVKAAFALGTAGVQVGSIFIIADESAASEAYKQAVLNSTDTSTALTRAFSGKWARGIQNEFMQRMQASGLPIPYYTIQNQLMSSIRAHAQKHNIKDFIALWAGQSAGKSVRASTHQIITALINML
ncbi:nitronate monooxygenase [Mucilaginibacter sp. JRF]|uniref:NAD(P)H-dependent flavin oxidoreductase n=1 Tax=Mucilaginibacter sp. JRF TaxID=2780088 RepID=UPI001882E9EC|nr:nitronate monooxygenase [Mucilaginibacter sp. JRF]MBE9584541.1 nitronate monooxygenase [Mucilaginibacter sp. JRF]